MSIHILVESWNSILALLRWLRNWVGGSSQYLTSRIQDDFLPSGETRLIEALLKHDVATVQYLVDAGADVNKCSEREQPLAVAVCSADENLMHILLEAGADPNAKIPKQGLSNLQLACLYRNLTAIKCLLNHGANPDGGKEDGSSQPLKMSLEVEDVDTRMQILNILLAHGADVNAADVYGSNTPFQAACQRGEKVIMELFLEHGADFSSCTGRGLYPLELVMMHGYCGAAKILAQYMFKLGIAVQSQCAYAAVFDSCSACLQLCIEGGGNLSKHRPVHEEQTCLVQRALLIDRVYPCKDGDTLCPKAVGGDRTNSITQQDRLAVLSVLVHAGATLHVDQEPSMKRLDWAELRPEMEEQLCLCIRAFWCNVNHVNASLSKRFRRAAYDLMPNAAMLMCLAGYHPTDGDVYYVHRSWVRRWHKKDDITNKLLQNSFCIFRDFVVQPRTLQNLAILTVRSCLRNNVIYEVQQLEVPPPISSQITLSGANTMM